MLDLFRQILLQIEYAGGSDHPITLLCTRWTLKLDNWTSTGTTSSGATSIDTLFIEFQLDLICLHSRGGDAHISCASVYEPAHSLDRLPHKLFGDILYPLKYLYGSPSISIPLICYIPISKSQSPLHWTPTAPTGLVWDASSLRLPAGHCSSPVLPASGPERKVGLPEKLICIFRNCG